MTLLIALCICLVISYYCSKHELISPSFLFTAGFILCAVWYFACQERWKSSLQMRTFLVIVLGVAEFITVAFIVRLFHKKKRRVWLNCDIISTSKCVDSFVVFIEIITILITLLLIMKLTGTASIPNAIYAFRHANTFTTDVIRLPHFVTTMRRFCNAAGYWYAYVLIHKYYNKSHKIDKVYAIVVVLSIINGVLLGGRGDAVNLIAALGVFWYMLNSGDKWGKTLKFKQLFIIIGAGCVILYSFQALGNALGRETDMDAVDYIAQYCGAEIANLNLFLSHYSGSNRAEVWGGQTFYTIIDMIGPRFISGFQKYNLDLPFVILNGHSVGNVYTIFYPFIYDFGYFGAFILTMVMAAFSQVVYMKCRDADNKKMPAISRLLYAYIAPAIFLSFFSNKFYEQILNLGLVYKLLFWILLNCSLRIKGRK